MHARRERFALMVPVLGLIWVLLFSVTRWVITPTGFAAMLTGLALIHAVTCVYGLTLIRNTHTRLSIIILLVLLNLSITSLSHYFKTSLYGFGFYYIKSNSMQPTLYPNDVILVNTWLTKRNPIASNDIVIFQDTTRTRGLELIKRVARTRQQKEFFVLGDNPRHSMDSRHFGWVDQSVLKAKASFIVYSFSEKTKSFISL
jgi:signal peptidase I